MAEVTPVVSAASAWNTLGRPVWWVCVAGDQDRHALGAGVVSGIGIVLTLLLSLPVNAFFWNLSLQLLSGWQNI